LKCLPSYFWVFRPSTVCLPSRYRTVSIFSLTGTVSKCPHPLPPARIQTPVHRASSDSALPGPEMPLTGTESCVLRSPGPRSEGTRTARSQVTCHRLAATRTIQPPRRNLVVSHVLVLRRAAPFRQRPWCAAAAVPSLSGPVRTGGPKHSNPERDPNATRSYRSNVRGGAPLSFRLNHTALGEPTMHRDFRS
jgi:hypothetical protein